MRLWKKQPVPDVEQYRIPEPTKPGEPVLPGSAGYRTAQVSKGGMPQSRFTFVRPDGKREP
jgi:hypothetical protein